MLKLTALWVTAMLCWAWMVFMLVPRVSPPPTFAAQVTLQDSKTFDYDGTVFFDFPELKASLSAAPGTPLALYLKELTKDGSVPITLTITPRPPKALERLER